MTQPILVKYIVAYGYQDKFELTQQEANALVKAAEAGNKVCKFKDRVFSTNFTWLVPEEETKEVDFDSKQLGLCEDVAEWLSRDVNGLDWPYPQTLTYSKKLMGRVGYDKVRELWNECANGAYPSVKRFLSEAKQISDLEDVTLVGESPLSLPDVSD